MKIQVTDAQKTFGSDRVGAVRIVSDGTPMGTKVFVGGEAIPNICEIEILPINPRTLVRARITVLVDELDMVADVALSHKSLRRTGEA